MPLRMSGTSCLSLKRFTWSQDSPAWKAAPSIARARQGLTKRPRRSRSRRLAEEFRRAVDLADIAQHARPKRDLVERTAVAQHRGLGLRATHEIAPRSRRQAAPRGVVDLLQGQKFFVERRVHKSGTDHVFI